jgi:glycosyltransferase involved in cell wall biosynthesis
MKKLLIFMNEKVLKPTGGPVGYLYNLKSSISDEHDFHFIKDIKLERTWKEKLRGILKRSMGDKFKKILLNYRLVNSIYYEKYSSGFDFSEYKAVHFHTTNSMYMNRKSLEGYKGKVILTSHSPKPAHLEIVEDQLCSFERKIYSKMIKKLENIDLFAFNRADVIVFPCQDAEEPYSNNWEEYKTIKREKESNFKYVPTGCIKARTKSSKTEIRDRFNIPQNAFVICYVGRHNKTKGFNVLKEIGEEILNKHENVYFLIAGKEEPLKGIPHKRWVEVGWTNDPHSIMAASDLFVLPNQETYFDLILLEALSLGKLILLSETGGNKYFKKFEENGLYYFDTQKKAIRTIENIMRFNDSKIQELEQRNLVIYSENFTMMTFMEDYSKMIEEVIEG